MTPTKELQKLIFRLVILALILGGLVMVPAGGGYKLGEMQSYIIQGQTADQAAFLVSQHGGKVTSSLEIIDSVAALLPAENIPGLRAEQGIRQITSNAITRLTDSQFEGKSKDGVDPATDYPDEIGADLAWKKGATGDGVTVAIVDTGIAFEPALNKGMNGKKRSLLGWADFIDSKKNPFDPNGHGTHVAGIIANAAKGTDGEWDGVAPGVDLVAVRVLDQTGTGTYESVIQGIQWVVKHKDDYKIRVLNLSLHALVQSPYWADPLNQAVMKAWANGITVVVAAGNDGSAPMTISVPGNIPYVITVGAFTDNYTPSDWSDDIITSFSASGPTLDNFVKPDLVAPGAHIVSTMQSSSYIAKQHDANKVNNQYFSMAGTSQSAAVVSGAAALVLSKNQSLSPDEVKYRLMFTALPWINAQGSDALYSIWQQGTGRVNAFDAVYQKVNGRANQGMDIQADLKGKKHYQGYSYFDGQTGMFHLGGDYGDLINTSLGAWSGKLGAWSGSSYGSWADGLGAWSGKLGAWSGGLGVWSGKLGAWSGKLGAWSGKLGAWSGSFEAWSGGYTIWVGKLGAWSGSLFLDPAYISSFSSGTAPDANNASTSLSNWIEEPIP